MWKSFLNIKDIYRLLTGSGAVLVLGVHFLIAIDSGAMSEKKSSASAQEEKSPSVTSLKKEETQKLETLSKTYSKQVVLKANVEKLLKLSLLGKEKKSSGSIELKAGKLHLELEGDEKVSLYSDKKTVWLVTHPPKEFADAPKQVVKAKMHGLSKEKLGIAVLLTGEGILSVFKATGLQEENSKKTIFLQPSKTSSDFKRAQLVVNSEINQMESLSYWDNLDNQTTYTFKNIVKMKTIPDGNFVYKPGPQDEITELK